MRPKDTFVGRTILDGQFEIVEKIGTGGMGAVYKALQPAMNRMVAIKILHPKLANRADLSSRFRREARAMSQLSHPNTTKVFMFGELPEDDSLYIVMEYLEGKNLNQKVRRDGPLPVERAIPILVMVCEALEEAHGMGIVHRDMKPENIFLCTQAGLTDFPKVLDFGLAKVTEQQMHPGSVILTQEGMVFGTPEFMSPEQAQGKTLDPRSDIYSLAVILYEVLTAKLPFNARTPMEYIQKHVMEVPIALNQRVEGKQFPEMLEFVLQKALAKNPDDRYQSAAEFSAALRQSIQPGAVPPPQSRAATTAQAPTQPDLESSGAASDTESADIPGVHSVKSTRPGTNVSARAAGRGAGAPAVRPPTGPLVLVLVAVACLLLGVVLAVVIMRLMIP